MIKRILALAVVAGLMAGFVAYAAETPKAPAAKKETAAKEEYVGAKKCMPCHIKVYKAWAETKHAKAFEGLKAASAEQLTKMNELLKTEVKEHPEADAACVGCHVTGYKLAGGYPAADSTKNVALAAVGCEDCHGPGSKHMAVPMSDKEGKKKSVLAPTAETCKKCHTETIAPKFDFAEMSKKVHPVAAAAPAK